MEQVKQMVEGGGVSITTAIKEALRKNGLPTVTSFADKHHLNRSATSAHLSGAVRANDETLAALVAELGGTPDEWAALLWLAGKPASVGDDFPLAANQ